MRRSRYAIAILVLCAGLALRGDTDRAQRLGAQLICSCGCTQGALVCNHVGCPVVTQMRAEIAQRAASTDSDDLVLQSFVQEYGTQVLANPTKQGFNLLAWVMPWIAVGLGLIVLLTVVRRWSRRPLLAGMTGTPGTGGEPEVETEAQARVRREVKAEMERDR